VNLRRWIVVAVGALAAPAAAQVLEPPDEDDAIPTDGRAIGDEDDWLPWGQTTYYPALQPAEPVANLVHAFPAKLLRRPVDLPDAWRAKLPDPVVDGPSVVEIAVQIIPHLLEWERHRLLLYGERRSLVTVELMGWLPAGEVPTGAHVLGAWWVWSNGLEMQRAERYPEDPEIVRREIARRASSFNDRDVERHVEAGAELNRSIEIYMLRYRLSLEDACARVKRERIEIARELIVGYFGAFASAAGTLAMAPAPGELQASMKPSTLAQRQRYRAPTVRSGEGADDPLDNGANTWSRNDPTVDVELNQKRFGRALRDEPIERVTTGEPHYQYDDMHPGPLPDGLARTFYGSRYNPISTKPGESYYRVGGGREWGRYFTRRPIKSEILARMDLAVKALWTDETTGAVQGNTSPITTMYEWQFPTRTAAYEGTARTQGRGFTGGGEQIVVTAPPKGARWRRVATVNTDGVFVPTDETEWHTVR